MPPTPLTLDRLFWNKAVEHLAIRQGDVNERTLVELTRAFSAGAKLHSLLIHHPPRRFLAYVCRSARPRESRWQTAKERAALPVECCSFIVECAD